MARKSPQAKTKKTKGYSKGDIIEIANKGDKKVTLKITGMSRASRR